jgi:hypothetical protein
VHKANKEERNTEDRVETSSVQLRYFLQGTFEIEGGAKFVQDTCSIVFLGER